MSLPVALTVILTSSLLQSPPASAPAASQPASPLLSGPSAVEDDAGKLTLVKRTFDGKIESVGSQPDAVAIAMLDLTPEQKAKYDEINSARMTAFDQIIRNNYALVVEMASLQGEPDDARRRDVLLRMQRALKPYVDRGTFFTEMWPHLTDEQRDQTRKMVEEYAYERTQAIRREAGENVSPQRIVLRERLETLGLMVRESIERQVALAREGFAILAQELDLTPEQFNAAQAIFQPLAVKQFQNIEVTPAERSAAFAEFNKLLTAGQKQKLFGILLRQYQAGGAPAASAPAASQPATSCPDEIGGGESGTNEEDHGAGGRQRQSS
jgi:hypothetical protein